MAKYEFETSEELINAAIEVMEMPNYYPEDKTGMCDPQTVEKYLLLKHKQEKYEIFSAMFLNSKNQILKLETLFRGSINSAQVYPRTVAQKCLENNAAAIIFCHHHPSGDIQPSESDIALTIQLKKTLALIDVKVLDHFVLGNKNAFSMASHQMI